MHHKTGTGAGAWQNSMHTVSSLRIKLKAHVTEKYHFENNR